MSSGLIDDPRVDLGPSAARRAAAAGCGAESRERQRQAEREAAARDGAEPTMNLRRDRFAGFVPCVVFMSGLLGVAAFGASAGRRRPCMPAAMCTAARMRW